MADIDRLLSKVSYVGDCWLWVGGRNFRMGDFACAPRRASWIIYNGPVDSATCVVNTCDNSKCINPKHLKTVSKSQHSKDTKSLHKPRVVKFYLKVGGQINVVRGLPPSPIPFLTERQESRLLSRLDKTGTCWIWTGECKDKGYGDISLNGKHYFVHRVMYAIHYGVDPGNFMVDHTCNTRACCNPKHLELVTPKENTQRMMAQGRHYTGQGNTIVPMKYHHQIVDDVISQRKTMKQLAKKYGVGRSCISRIVAKYEDADMRRKLSDSGIKFIVSSDLSYRDLAKQFEVSKETIARVRHLAGCLDKRLHLTDEQRQIVLNSDEKGTVLAKQLGVHECTIYRLRAQQRHAEHGS